jgi:hypothetical protein
MPAALPIQAPSKMRVGHQPPDLGLTVPPNLLGLADQVIE